MLFFSQDEGRYRWNSNKAEGYAKRVRMIMRDAKKVNTKKLIAIFTAISLAFLQAAPVGVAANAPVDQIDGRNVSVPVQAVTDTPSQPAPTQAVIPPNPLMNTGGISKIEETEIPQNDEIQATNQTLDGEQQDAVSELAQYAQNLTDPEQRIQFEAALSEASPDAQYRYRVGANGDQSWSWPSTVGETTYTLHQDHRMIPVGIDGQMQEEIQWSFEALSVVTKAEVEQYGSQLPTDSLSYFEEALLQTDDATVFSKTISGTDTLCQWNDKLDASKLYTLSLHPGPDGATEAAFSVQTTIMPWGLTHLGEKLTYPGQRSQFEAAIRDTVPLSPENWQTLLTRIADANSRITSWSWTSADEKITYILRQDRRMVPVGIPDVSGEQQFQEEIFWSFEAKTEAPVSEVQENIGQITDSYVRDQAQQAFDQAVANGQQTFTKIMSGGDIIYQWNDAVDASVLHQLFLAQIPSGANWSFSTQMPLMPQGLSHLEENLSDSAQRAQFDSAIQDAAPLNRENWQTLLMRTIDVNGRVNSWSWMSADGKTTYTLKLDAVSPGAPVWTFAAVIQVSTDDVRQELMSWGTTSPEYLRAFEQAVQAGAVFIKTVSGNQESYQWNLPMSGLAQYAQNLTDVELRAQFEAALLVGGYSVQSYNGGSNSWRWTSADGSTVYLLVNNKNQLPMPDGSQRFIDEWGFSAENQTSAQAIRDQLQNIGTPEMRAMAESAITDGTVFKRITMGVVVQFQWQSVSDPELTYQLMIIDDRISFATMFNQFTPDVQRDAQGNVISTTYRNYDWNSLIWLYMPAYATVYPSTMKYYDAQGNLLRELISGQYGNRTLIVYGNASVTAIPAKVEIYSSDQNLYSTLYYDSRGFLTSYEVLPAFMGQLRAAFPAFIVSSPAYISGSNPSLFQITIINPVSAMGEFNQMSFHVDQEGQIDFDTLETTYEGADFQWFGNQLLLGRVKDLQPSANDVAILTLMSQLTINHVDANGTIQFILNGASNVADAMLFSIIETYLDDDAVITRSEMLSLFSRLETDGVVSEVEFSILKMIQNNPDRYPQPDYVRSLTDAVVFGSLANTTYQGAPLGNLQGGSGADHLDKLVNKWFLGMDNPLVTTDYYGNPLSYQQATGSLFVNGLNYGDIMQGQLGDCYLMAGLAEIALRAPDFITDMFIDNGDGTYTVRFFNNGVADYVTIDRQLPVNMDGYLVYANHGAAATDPNAELWTALAEKAYVQITDKWYGRHNFYNAIGGGGSVGNIFNIVTGLVAGSIDIWSGTSFSSVVSSWLSGELIGLSSRGDAYLADGQYVVGNHWYALLDYNTTTQIFTLFNPWGVGYGLLTLAWNEIQQNFHDLVVTTGNGLVSNLQARNPSAPSFTAVPRAVHESVIQLEAAPDQDAAENVLDPVLEKEEQERPKVVKKSTKHFRNRSERRSRDSYQTSTVEAKHFFSEPLSYQSVLDDFLFQNFIAHMTQKRLTG